MLEDAGLIFDYKRVKLNLQERSEESLDGRTGERRLEMDDDVSEEMGGRDTDSAGSEGWDSMGAVHCPYCDVPTQHPGLFHNRWHARTSRRRLSSHRAPVPLDRVVTRDARDDNRRFWESVNYWRPYVAPAEAFTLEEWFEMWE